MSFTAASRSDCRPSPLRRLPGRAAGSAGWLRRSARPGPAPGRRCRTSRRAMPVFMFTSASGAVELVLAARDAHVARPAARCRCRAHRRARSPITVSVAVRTETLPNASTFCSLPDAPSGSSGRAGCRGLAGCGRRSPGAAPSRRCRRPACRRRRRRPSLVTTTALPRATAMCFCDQYSRLSRAVSTSFGVVSFRSRPVITSTAWSMS